MEHVLSTCTVWLVGTHHWRHKEQFQVEQDRYPFWQIIVVEEGSFEYKHSGVEAEAAKDDMVFFPANADFHRKAVSKLHFIHIMFELTSAVYPESAILRSFGRLLPEHRLSLRDFPRLHSTVSYMKKLLRLPAPLSPVWQEHLIADLWMCVCMDLEVHKPAGQLMREAVGDPLMEQVKREIESSAYGPLSLKKLAHDIRLSPVQLSRRFQAVYRMPPMRYVTQLRLERAKALLIEGDESMETIARICGYENGLYFSRIFSQHMGLSPTRYRALFRV